MENAPNTPGAEITRDGPYHMVNLGTTTSGSTYLPNKCFTCKHIADPAHTVDGPDESLRTYCAVHCTKCIRYRQNQLNEAREREREGAD